MAVAESTEPALLRAEGKSHRIKPKVWAKVKKSQRRHHWYDEQERILREEGPPINPALVRLTESLDRGDEDGALKHLVEIQQALDRNEEELRKANSRVRYAEATLADLEGEYARLRDWADARSYSVEGAGPRVQGSIAHNADGGDSLPARMGIADY